MTDNKKMLLVVDPQIDFVTGSLPVAGAAAAMDALAAYIDAHGETYAVKIVTADWHPYNHCSFDRKGGPWSPHCVQHSAGAALWQPLLEALNRSRGGFTLLYKGDKVNKDEYSILENESSAEVLIRLIAALDIAQVDVCGLAGNVCVLNTARDLVQAVGPEALRILLPYAPSLDDGTELRRFVADNRIAVLR